MNVDTIKLPLPRSYENIEDLSPEAIERETRGEAKGMLHAQQFTVF